MSVICLGSINIDEVYTVHHIVGEGETISSTSFAQFPGGKGANQSVAIAKAGGKVHHIGAVGKDGVWMKDLMKSNGIFNDKIVESQSDFSGKAIIQVSENGENAIVLYPGANHTIAMDYVNRGICSVNDAKWLLCQGELMTNTTATAIKLAKSQGLHVCLNLAPFSSSFAADLDLSMIDLLIVNEIEFKGLIKHLGGFENGQLEAEINFLMSALPNLSIFVLTLGSKGGILGSRTGGSINILNVAGANVKVIDSTGAGDTFVGYFLGNLLMHGLKDLNTGILREVFELANTAAAICCTRNGAMNSIPTRQEVLDYIF